MRKLLTFCCLSLLFFMAASTVKSQDLVRDTYWLSAGIGKSQFPSGMVAVGYEFRNKPALLTGRYVVNGEIMQAVEPGIKVNEIGLLYGLKAGKFHFSAGLSTIWGNRRGKLLYTDPNPLWGSGQHYEFIKYRTVGVPAEIRFITSLKHVGIGVTGFGNWNAENSFAGLNLSLYIGRME